MASPFESLRRAEGMGVKRGGPMVCPVAYGLVAKSAELLRFAK